MVLNKRQSERIEIFRSYFFICKKENNKHNCFVKNISITGACITSPKKIASKDMIYLHLVSEKDTVLKAEVAWNIDSEYGIRFLLEDNIDFEKISFVMNNIARYINK